MKPSQHPRKIAAGVVRRHEQSHSRNSSTGVALLEVLIALAVMGMIAILLANALNFSRQSLDRAIASDTRLETIVRQTRLRNWIEDMPVRYGQDTARAFLEGRSDGLRFRSFVTDGSFHAGDVATFTLSLETRDGLATLVVLGEGKRPDGTLGSVSLTLGENIEAVQIRYFGRRSGEAAPDWYKDWSDETFLPDLVKLEWTIEGGRVVPPLTLIPARIARQSVMSLSSLLPPG